jgi:hypothetical protein
MPFQLPSSRAVQPRATASYHDGGSFVAAPAAPAVPHFAASAVDNDNDDWETDASFRHMKTHVQRLAVPSSRRGAYTQPPRPPTHDTHHHEGTETGAADHQQHRRTAITFWPHQRGDHDRADDADVDINDDMSGSSTDGEPYCVIRFAQPPLVMRSFTGDRPQDAAAGDMATSPPRHSFAPADAGSAGRFALPLRDQWALHEPSTREWARQGRPIRGVWQCIAFLLAGCVIAVIVVVGRASSKCSGRNSQDCNN